MIRKLRKEILSYSVIYEAAIEGGYIAYVPILPGCHTQGETLEEAEKNIKEAILAYLESLLCHNEELPQERRILQGKVEIRI